MLSLPRLLKVAYLLILGGAILALCKPAPVHAQRAIAYPALPAQINITVTSNPFTAILSAQQMLFLAGAATMLPSGATILGSGTMNGGGFGGGMGMGGIQGGFGGGMGGGMGMGGMGMGGMGMRGGGGMGGFAGKGMGGFNGKKAL